MDGTNTIEAKERIINASIELFSKKGFDAASVNEIAEQANVTKALIYYYFKSKEEILDYLFVRFWIYHQPGDGFHSYQHCADD